MKKAFKIVLLSLSILVFLGLVGCNSLKQINAYNAEIESLRSEISRLEQELEESGDEPGLKDTLEYLKTEAALEKMYQELLELEGKK